MSRPVTRTSLAREVKEWEEAKKVLELTFATRKTLQEKGFSGTKRTFSSKRKYEAERFLALVAAEPKLYGEVGSDNWIRGLLTYLNEPTVLAWDDVTEWLKTPHHKEFFHKLPCKSSTSNITRVPVKRISDDEEESLHKDKVPRMKLAILKLEKYDPNRTVAAISPRTVSSILETDDEHLSEIDTPEFNQRFLEYVSTLDSDYDSEATTDPGEDTVVLANDVKPRVSNAQNEEGNDEAHASADVYAQDVDEPEIIEIPNIPEDASEAAVNMEVDDDDTDNLQQMDSPEWVELNDYYREFDELNVDNVDGNNKERLDNDTNNNALPECQNSNDSVPESQKSPDQVPTESIEVSSQNSNEGADETAMITSSSNAENVSGSSTNEPESEAVAACSKQITTTEAAPDPIETYKNCLTKAWEWTCKKTNFHQYSENAGSTLCQTCVENRERANVIQHVLAHLDSNMLVLYGPESNLDYGPINDRCSELYDMLNELGKGFQNNNTTCDCKGAIVD